MAYWRLIYLGSAVGKPPDLSMLGRLGSHADARVGLCVRLLVMCRPWKRAVLRPL